MHTLIAAVTPFAVTLREVLADLPHDAGTLVFALLVGSFVGLTWYGSRGSTVDKYKTGRRPGWGADTDRVDPAGRKD